MFIIVLLTQIFLQNKLWSAITDVKRELPSGYLINPAMQYEQKEVDKKKIHQNIPLEKRMADSCFSYWCFVLVFQVYNVENPN